MDWLLDFREEHPKTYRVALHIFSQLIAILIVAPIVFGIVFGGVWAFGEVSAEALQPQALPLSDNCVEDSKIGTITTAYCESDFGPDYLINNLGFITLVD